MVTVLTDTNEGFIEMARRSRSKSNHYNRPQGRRDLNTLSSLRSLIARLHPLPPMLVSRTPLRTIDDRRTFHPSPFTRPAVSAGRRADTKLVVPSQSLRDVQRLNHTVQFKEPRKVLICVRRKIRKEVIHAKGVGGSRVRKPKRNQFSDVKC